jgi:hypothetical protein
VRHDFETPTIFKHYLTLIISNMNTDDYYYGGSMGGMGGMMGGMGGMSGGGDGQCDTISRPQLFSISHITLLLSFPT